MKRAALLVFLAGCDEWKPTYNASVRRMAEYRLSVCIQNRPCAQSKSCYPEVQDFCTDAGLEKTCGEGFQGGITCVP